MRRYWDAAPFLFSVVRRRRFFCGRFISTCAQSGAVAGLPTTRCERSVDTEGGIKPAIASLALLFAFWAPDVLATRALLFLILYF